MKYSLVLVAAAGFGQVSATFGFGGKKFFGAKPYECPKNIDNICLPKHKGGLGYGGLLPGKELNNEEHDGFKYGGGNWKCGQKQQARDIMGRTFGGEKFLSADCGPGLEPYIEVGQKDAPEHFSMTKFEINCEEEGDMEMEFEMPGGRKCRTPPKACGKGKNYLDNKQCGGAKKVKFHYKPKKSKKCKIDWHHIDLDCDNHCKPGMPGCPGTPDDECKPGEPGCPGTPDDECKPGEPGCPGTPDDECKPGEPGCPGTPDDECKPGEPGCPGTPDDECTPGDKDCPEPQQPDDDCTPGEPGCPGTPDDECTPGEPGCPGTPDDECTPGEPNCPGTPEQPDEDCTPGEKDCPEPQQPDDDCTPGEPGCPDDEVTPPPVDEPNTPTTPRPTPPPTDDDDETPEEPVETPTIPEEPVETPSVPEEPVETPSVPEEPVETPSVPEEPVETPTVPEVPDEDEPEKPVDETPEEPEEPEEDGPDCPEVVPGCLNTWIPVLGECKNSLDKQCYCKHADLINEVYECIYANGETDDIIAEAVQALQGICAPEIPENPAIVTGGESITSCITVTGTPIITSAIYTTIVVDATVTVPCVTDGTTIEGSSTVTVIKTEVPVPEVTMPAPPKETGSTEKPEVPVEQPGKPSKPEVPGEETPEVPDVEKPETPVEETPEQPEQPGVQVPPPAVTPPPAVAQPTPPADVPVTAGAGSVRAGFGLGLAVMAIVAVM